MAIVTDGLLLHLDAGNATSYPGTGKLWYDLSNNFLTASATESSPSTNYPSFPGPIYTGSNSGQFIFSGSYLTSSQYVTPHFRIPATASLRPTQITVETFASTQWASGSSPTGPSRPLVSSTTLNSSGFRLVYNDSTDVTNNSRYGLGFYIFSGSTLFNVNVPATYSSSTATYTSALNNSDWHHIVATFDGEYIKLYVDTVLQEEKYILNSGSRIVWSTSPDFFIGAQSFTLTAPDFRTYREGFSGSIANVKIYNRALTDAEITQNFNEMNSRYTLTVPDSSSISTTTVQTQTLSSRQLEPSSSLNVTYTSAQSLTQRVLEPSSSLNVTNVSAQTLLAAPSSSINVTNVSAQSLLAAPSSSINITNVAVQVLVSGASFPPPPPPPPAPPPRETPGVTGSLWGWGGLSDSVYGLNLDSGTNILTQIDSGSTWKTVYSNGQTYLTVGVKTNGTMWVWGNYYEEIPYYTTRPSASLITEPIQIGNETDWVDIKHSWLAYFGMGIKSNGTLWSWGYNASGQLGLGYSQVPSPVFPISQVGTDTDWKIVSVGDSHTTAIKNNGTLWSWGSNYNGELGRGLNTSVTSSTPTQVGTDTWVSASCLRSSILAIKTDGTLWGWGTNSNRQLGLGDAVLRTSPVQVGTDNTWKHVSVASQHSLGIKSDGTLWAWGANNYGQLGLSYSGSDISTPTQVGSDTNWAQVQVSITGHSLAIKTDGTLWGWGFNGAGELGLDDFDDRVSPTQIGTDTDWVKIITGNQQSFAVKSDGSLYGCGWNLNGQLGIGTTIIPYEPYQIGTDTDWTIYAVSDYGYSIQALKSNGTLWGWGESGPGSSLGFGETESVTNYDPVQVGTDTDWRYISRTGGHTLALKTNGTLWGWGGNGGYELGLGDQVDRTTPIQIGSDTWIDVSAGYDHSLGIKFDGTLWAWGINSSGQCGASLGGIYVGTVQEPLLISTASWRSVHAGVERSLAIKSDGTLWGTGYNGGGGLGIGVSGSNLDYLNEFVQVGTDNDWEYVTLTKGFNTTIATKTDGTLWAWGDNYTGQLGVGSEQFFDTGVAFPVQIGTDSDWKNAYYGEGLKTNGTFWNWGSNIYGEMGIGVQTLQGDVFEPTQIGTDTDWLAVQTANTLDWGSETVALRSSILPTPSPTPSFTPSPTPSFTPSPTPTPSFTPSPTPSLTFMPTINNEAPYKDIEDSPSLTTLEVYNITSGSFFRYSQKVREVTAQLGTTIYTNNKVKVAPPPTFTTGFFDVDGIKVLSPSKSIVALEKKKLSTGRNRVSISLSPSDVINQNIVRNIGLENINSVYGLPSGFYTYQQKTLDKIRKHYNQYHYINVDYNNYIRIVGEIGLVLDQVIDYFIPARANLIKGVTIDTNLLERPRIKLIKNVKAYGSKTRKTIKAVGSLTGSTPDYAATFNLSQTINTVIDNTVQGKLNTYKIEFGEEFVPDIGAKTNSLKTLISQSHLYSVKSTYNTITSASVPDTELIKILVSPQPQNTNTFQLSGLVESGSDIVNTTATYNTKTTVLDMGVVNLNKVKYNDVNGGNPGSEPFNRVYSRKLFSYEIDTPRNGGVTSLYPLALNEIPPSADFRDIGVITYFNNKESIYRFPQIIKIPVYPNKLNLNWNITTQEFDNIENWQYGKRYNENDVVYQDVSKFDETLSDVSSYAQRGNKKYYVFKTKPLYETPEENVSHYLYSTPSYLPPSLDNKNWSLLKFQPIQIRSPRRIVFDTFIVGDPELNNYKLTTVSLDTIISVPNRYVDTFTVTELPASGYVTGQFIMQNIFTLFAAQSDQSNIRLRLYKTLEKRNADISRTFEQLPTGDHGVLLDMVFGQENTLKLTNPIPTIAAGGLPPEAKIYYTIDNLSGNTKNLVSFIFYYFALEVEDRFPRGHLRKHYRNFRDNNTALKRRTRFGCKNIDATTVDGLPVIQIFLSEGNQITVSSTQTNTEITTGGGGTLNVT